MTADIEQWPPPDDADAFESLCLDLWKDIWQDAGAQKNGRSGQSQSSVDLVGRYGSNWIGIQCKKKKGLLYARMTIKELEREVLEAKHFHPPLSKFILATTGPTDVRLQRRAREISAVHNRQGLFEVEVWSWDDIWSELYRRRELLHEIASTYWPRLVRASTSPEADKKPSPDTHFSPRHQLPPPPAMFSGREEDLVELETVMLPPELRDTTVFSTHLALHGMGGVGKTSLAIVLAHRLKATYSDAQIFLDLHGVSPQGVRAMSPTEAMSSIIRSFRLDVDVTGLTQDEVSRYYHAILTEAGRVVIVLDNAEGAAQVKPLLPPLGCLLLVTSRAQFSLPGFVIRHVDCLPPDKARSLLLAIAPRIGVHAQEVAELCGCLPLALEVFASFVSDQQLYSVQELAERLRCRQEHLGAVEAAFELSCEALLDNLRKRWFQLSVFPGTFDLGLAAEVAWSTKDRGESKNSIAILVKANLVEWDKKTNRFKLHDLVRSFCSQKLSDEERNHLHSRLYPPDLTRTIVLVYGLLEDGNSFWVFVAVKPTFYELFIAAQKAGTLDLYQFTPYGEIIVSGVGTSPPEDIVRKVAEMYQTDPESLLPQCGIGSDKVE